MDGYFKRDTPELPPSVGWFVEGRWYANSAAKFWCGILCELAATYPDAGSVALEACVVGPLTSELLDPRASLQRMFDSAASQDVERELEDLVKELELLGPPGSVTYRICDQDGRTVEEGLLPEIDAEVLAHLAVWLPEWAGIHEAEWNDRDLEAKFTADRPDQDRAGRVSFTLHHCALHEGLYRCLITLHLAH